MAIPKKSASHPSRSLPETSSTKIYQAPRLERLGNWSHRTGISPFGVELPVGPGQPPRP